ncbi:MAG: hypothetical protein SPI25_06835 [Dialister sp.]|nr:hypothetical protein [Dialister sp.]
MERWKKKLDLEHTWYLYLCILILIILISLQESQIADLQERMMNVESSCYDDQMNNIRWEAESALEENKEQGKDIYTLQRHDADHEFRLKQLEWDHPKEE